MANLSLDAARDAKQAGRGPDRENDAGITDEYAIDYDEHSPVEVNLKPNVMVVFDHIARVSINTYGYDDILTMEQNLQGAGKYGFDIGLTLANPQIIGGDLWAPDGVDEQDYPTYMIAQDAESEENPYGLREDIVEDEDGTPIGKEAVGIEDLPGGNKFEGEIVDEVPDFIEVSIGSSRAMDILGVLDTAGMWFSTQDGEVVEGLFETPPNFGTDLYDSEEDGYPRLTGYPSLRSDMVGQRGAITAEFGVDDVTEADTRSAIEVDIFKVNEDDELEALYPLTTDDDAYAKPEYPRYNNTFWSDSDAAGGAAPEADVGADTEPETSQDLSDASAMMGDDTSDADDEEDDDTEGDSGNANSSDSSGGDDEQITYDDLNEDAQELVDDAVGVIGAKGMDSITELDGEDTGTEYDSFEDRVAMEDFKVNVTADVLADIIDEEANV